MEPHPSDRTTQQRRAIVDGGTLQLAEFGMRGATLRKIAARSGISLARVTSAYANKDELIAACFADVVDRDLARLAAMAEETDGTDLLALLWALCEDAGGLRRADNLVLTELLISSGHPQLGEIFRRWITQRRDLLRTAGARSGIDPLVIDLLGLIVLMECRLATSNYDSLAYRLIARGSLEEALARLAEVTPATPSAALGALAERYHAPAEIESVPGLTRSDTHKRRDQIVDAAADIFIELGSEHLTNRSVAERAGVSLALTTYHFKSITELTLAAMRRAVERFVSQIELDAGGGELPDAMLEVRRRAFQAPDTEVHIHRAVLHVSLAAARVPDEAQFGRLIRRQIGRLTYAAVRQSRRDADVSRTAAASFMLWAGACFLLGRQFAPGEQPYDFDAQATVAGRSLLGLQMTGTA